MASGLCVWSVKQLLDIVMNWSRRRDIRTGRRRLKVSVENRPIDMLMFGRIRGKVTPAEEV